MKRYCRKFEKVSWAKDIKEYLDENNLYGIIVGGAAFNLLAGINKKPKDVDIVVLNKIESESYPLFKNSMPIDLIQPNREIKLKNSYGSFEIRTEHLDNTQNIDGLEVINLKNLILTAKSTATKEKIIKQFNLPVDYLKGHKSSNDRKDYFVAWSFANNLNDDEFDEYSKKLGFIK